MTIRYRRPGDPTVSSETPAREGEVADLPELEALVQLGSLAAQDEVSLDGVRFKKASQVPELKQAFRSKPRPTLGTAERAIVLVGAGILAVLALGVALKIASVVVKLAIVGGAMLGGLWVWKKLKGRGDES